MQEVGGSSPPVPTKHFARSSAGKPEVANVRTFDELQRTAKVTTLLDHILITLTLPDGSTREAAPGTPVREFASGVLPQGVMRKALAAKVDDQLVDLTLPARSRRAAQDRDAPTARTRWRSTGIRRRTCSPRR